MFNLDWQPPVLQTERLTLRPLTSDDAANIFAFCSNPRMTRYTLWNTHETLDDTLNFLNDFPFTRYPNQEPDPLGIVQKADALGHVIGTIGCFWASKKDGVMELGYNLAESLWGCGIIAEAAACLIQHVFEEYPVKRIQARILQGNVASERVVAKLGLVFEGTLRSALIVRGQRVDVSYYSVLRP